MLDRLRLTDFKSFVNEEVELSPVTLLVGANASGKSNLLDALKFLRATVTDMPLAEVIDGEDGALANRWPGMRGGAPEAARAGTQVFSIESTWRVQVPEDSESVDNATMGDKNILELTHRIACRTIPEPKLEAESLGLGRSEGNLFRTGASNGSTIEVPWPSYSVKRDVQNPPPTRVTNQLSVLWEILGSINPGSPIVPHEIGENANALGKALASIRYVAIETPQMRGYGRRGKELGDDGSNLSGVLARLCENQEEKRTLVEWLSELCAPELADLDFIDVPEIGDVMAVLVESGGKRISARSLSDGTLRFLGMLVALRTSEPGSLILTEEIESGLHPTRVRLLVEYLQQVARDRGLQIIATTHSPVVLQWLDEEMLGRAIVFGRIPEREGTLMRRLCDLPHFSEIVKRKGVGELFTTGWLEMSL